MNRKIKQEKAITLIALVITIIVLLILAAISIATLTGENGILTKASKAKEETKIAEYKEALELIGIGLQPEKVTEKLSSEEYMRCYADKIENDDKFKGSNVILNTEKNPITIQVITKEGYVYLITEDKVEVMGKEGETAPPDLQESNVTFTYKPTDWTNGSVEVKIETEITGYTLQYSTDGTNWKNYTETVTKKDNGAIHARLINNLDEVGGTATGNIENIDRLVPNSFTPTATSTTNSITLTGSTTDAEKTETDGCSGIDKYYFSKDDGATWEPSAGQTTATYTFSGLDSGTTYDLKMKAVDNAGNEVITNTISKETIKTISNLKAGEYVNYIDKNGTTRKCIVLYDTNYNATNSSDYGIQIITADTVEDVQLGNGTGSSQPNNRTYFYVARDSYNNAISALNTRANAYLNTTYASSARCVGSVPNNPNSEASGYYTSSESYMSSYNGTFKNADTNYEIDWNQMNVLNIHKISKTYWLDSRIIGTASYGTYFYVRTGHIVRTIIR